MKKLHLLKTIVLLLTSILCWNSYAQQPELVADFNTNTITTDPRYMATIEGKIYFTAKEHNGEYELYIYDGTDTEIVRFRDRYFTGAPRNFTKYGTDIYFSASDATSGVELWKFDGVSPTLIDINPSGSSSPQEMFYSIQNSISMLMMAPMAVNYGAMMAPRLI